MHIHVTTRFQQRFGGLVDARSYALLSTITPARAVVFVHGFTGHPGRTWRRIDDFVEEPWWKESDLYFFGYASVEEAIRETADRLARFVTAILAIDRDDLLLGDVGLQGGGEQSSLRTYEELVLVAHSQGGLVVRQAVLDLLWEPLRKGKRTREEDVIASANLRLFAPAIWGARVAGMKGLALASLGLGTIARIALGASPSYKEMQQESTLLEVLRTSTESKAGDHGDVAAFRASIAWAGRDQVVVPGHQYECDPKSVFLHKETNHTTICKSADPKSDAMSFVERGEVG